MPKYLSPFDPHVHLRGNEYPNQDFIGLAFRDARVVGLLGMAEMPNPVPQLTSSGVVARRVVDLLGRSDESGVYHFVNVGLTNSEEQVIEAVRLAENDRSVMALKIFFTHSTGNMGVLDKGVQKRMWEVLAERGFKGVVMGHYEDEEEYSGEFVPGVPQTHSRRQHERAEVGQVIRQVGFARDAGFEGTMYIAHVSSPDTVDYVLSVRDGLPFKVVLEATFHHLLLCWGAYPTSGNLVKMNPPLRCRSSMVRLQDHLLAGNIDVIGTDHAPHPIEKKQGDNPFSGIPALPFWPRFIGWLRERGVSEGRIADLTVFNALRVFGLGFLVSEVRFVECEYDPGLWDAYGWNPFEWFESCGGGLSGEEMAQVASSALGSTDRGENGLYGKAVSGFDEKYSKS